VTPQELLDAARDLIRTPRSGTAGLWPRAAALLGRQAIESALEEVWRQRAPGVERASVRAQLLCLSRYSDDSAPAYAVAHAWSALTHACHRHPYELAPTAEELEGWLDQASDLVWSVGLGIGNMPSN